MITAADIGPEAFETLDMWSVFFAALCMAGSTAGLFGSPVVAALLFGVDVRFKVIRDWHWRAWTACLMALVGITPACVALTTIQSSVKPDELPQFTNLAWMASWLQTWALLVTGLALAFARRLGQHEQCTEFSRSRLPAIGVALLVPLLPAVRWTSPLGYDAWVRFMAPYAGLGMGTVLWAVASGVDAEDGVLARRTSGGLLIGAAFAVVAFEVVGLNAGSIPQFLAGHQLAIYTVVPGLSLVFVMLAVHLIEPRPRLGSAILALLPLTILVPARLRLDQTWHQFVPDGLPRAERVHWEELRFFGPELVIVGDTRQCIEIDGDLRGFACDRAEEHPVAVSRDSPASEAFGDGDAWRTMILLDDGIRAVTMQERPVWSRHDHPVRYEAGWYLDDQGPFTLAEVLTRIEALPRGAQVLVSPTNLTTQQLIDVCVPTGRHHFCALRSFESRDTWEDRDDERDTGLWGAW